MIGEGRGVYVRSRARRLAWERLTPYQRWTILSSRPDEVEADSALRAAVMSELEATFGRRVWTAQDAIPAEPEGVLERKEPERAMTLGQVAAILGLSVERVRTIEAAALRKLRRRAATLGNTRLSAAHKGWSAEDFLFAHETEGAK